MTKIANTAKSVIAAANRFYTTFDPSTCPTTLLGTVSYSETPGLNSYYAAYFNDQDQLQWFSKVIQTILPGGVISAEIMFTESYRYTVDGLACLRQLRNSAGRTTIWTLLAGRMADSNTVFADTRIPVWLGIAFVELDEAERNHRIEASRLHLSGAPLAFAPIEQTLTAAEKLLQFHLNDSNLKVNLISLSDDGDQRIPSFGRDIFGLGPWIEIIDNRQSVYVPDADIDPLIERAVGTPSEADRNAFETLGYSSVSVERINLYQAGSPNPAALLITLSSQPWDQSGAIGVRLMMGRIKSTIESSLLAIMSNETGGIKPGVDVKPR